MAGRLRREGGKNDNLCGTSPYLPSPFAPAIFNAAAAEASDGPSFGKSFSAVGKSKSPTFSVAAAPVQNHAFISVFLFLIFFFVTPT